MAETITWQTSSPYLSSLVAAMKTLGHLGAVLPRLDEPTRAMVATPSTQAWWPGQQHLAMVEALEAVAGVEGVKAVCIRGSRERMGPIMRPLTSVVLSLTKTPMLALLSRLGTFVSPGIKGIDARFHQHSGKPGGFAVFTFPQQVPAVMAASWYGLFDVGFGLARSGRIVAEHIEPTVHRFEVTW